MKNLIKLPAYVRRGKIDLSQRLEVAGVETPAMPCVLEVLEREVAEALEKALSPESLLAAEAKGHRLKIQQIAEARKKLNSQPEPKEGNDESLPS